MAENFVGNPSLLKDVLEKEVQRKTGVHWELYGEPRPSCTNEDVVLDWVCDVMFGPEGVEKLTLRIIASSFLSAPTELFNVQPISGQQETFMTALCFLQSM